MKTPIQTTEAPKAIGPYSQAIRIGEFLYSSGQIALDPNTGSLVLGGVEEQTKQVMKNLMAVLAEARMGFEDVVKTTIFIKNMDDFAKVNEIYGSYLKEPYPARSTVEVARLPKDVLIEIDVIASR